jgi:hypothetical protein
VLDTLAECGYWYDSSYFALRGHDRYGRLTTPIDGSRDIVEVRPGLFDLPVSCLRAGPMSLPWAGGGYFRLSPYSLYRRGVEQRLRAASWFRFYLHPWELDPREVPPRGMQRIARFRTCVGRARVGEDLRRLLAEFGSTRIDRPLQARGCTPPAA